MRKGRAVVGRIGENAAMATRAEETVRNPIPEFEDITAAAERLKGIAHRTPLLPADALGRMAGAKVFVKAENLQSGGAFKFRGAYNRLSQLDAEQRKRGVVAWSSGNHAQGVAAAGQRLGIRTAIVMPRDAPAVKIENTRAFGAEVVLYDRYSENREAIGEKLAAERGAIVVPPYDDPYVIAGQGTVALEMFEQARALGYELDIVLAPCSGGGLVAGCALALHRLSPRTKVYSVEPEGFDDMRRSLASGAREQNRPSGRTACDALMAPTPGELTFAVNRRLLAGGVAVSDEMVFAAMRHAWQELKLVAEPSGASALAAVLHGLVECAGKTVGVVLSGGNVDGALYRTILK